MSTDLDSVPQPGDATVLATALRLTSRKATNAPKARLEALADPLLDPHLLELAQHSLKDALGPRLTGAEPLPLTLWRGGATHAGKIRADGSSSPGKTLNLTLATFADVLRQRTAFIAPKQTGWVVEPTTNPTGRRTNEATLAMHAVFLDADEAGPWDACLTGLRALGLAHVAYQSGGYRPDAPKWRLVLPLASPYPVTSEAAREAWKRLYHRLRALVGALGRLRGFGFDPRTDAPAIPWFLTERRNPQDPPREVVFSPGHALDLLALAFSLPEVEEDAPARPTRRAVGNDDERATVDLDDAAFKALVDALAEKTSAIPRGRRDLYLALPGALLDRGVPPEDVITLCTDVSLAYPRKHADKHRDNVHNAQTTVDKWRAGDPTYTRIGTLQASFPEVAAIVDLHLPDLVREEIIASASLVAQTAHLGTANTTIANTTVANTGTPNTDAGPAPVPPKDPRAKLRKQLEKIAEKRAEHKTRRKSDEGKILRLALQNGLAFAADVVTVVKDSFDVAGFELDLDVPFDEVAQVIIGLSGVASRPEIYRIAAEAFAKARERRKRWDVAAPEREKKRVTKWQSERLANTRDTAETYASYRAAKKLPSRA